jgi:ABC-type amino acid transport system permease subunit
MNELLLTEAARAAIEALPEFQAERAKSLADGWQRYFAIGRLVLPDGSILGIALAAV